MPFFARTLIGVLSLLTLSAFTAVQGGAEETAEVYDLCSSYRPVNGGRLFFVRHRHATLDPALRTLELNLFDPTTGKISQLQRRDEHIFIPPVISRDRTTICYQSIIEGSDYLVTMNLEEGHTIRLRFDTGGYFVRTAIDFDNDTVVSAHKRGEQRQALYIISNRAGTIRRFFNGRDFREVGFLQNGSVYFTDQREDSLKLGVVTPFTTKHRTLAEAVDFVERTPNGDVLIYAGREAPILSVEEAAAPSLVFYRVSNGEKIVLSEEYGGEILLSPDGSTCAVVEEETTKIVNIPSGDILYLLPVQSPSGGMFLTDFSLFAARGSRIYQLKHKTPAARLQEIHRVDAPLRLLGVSGNSRFVYYQSGDPRTVHILDLRDGSLFLREFSFRVFDILTPRAEHDGSFFVRGLVDSNRGVVRELYYYDMPARTLFGVASREDTDIRPYLRRSLD